MIHFSWVFLLMKHLVWISRELLFPTKKKKNNKKLQAALKSWYILDITSITTPLCFTKKRRRDMLTTKKWVINLAYFWCHVIVHPCRSLYHTVNKCVIFLLRRKVIHSGNVRLVVFTNALLNDVLLSVNWLSCTCPTLYCHRTLSNCSKINPS
jgi:hypothetical protein